MGAERIHNPGPSPRGWHRLQLAAECLQKFAWEYKGPEREKGPPKKALGKGMLMHLALAQHYSRMQIRQAGVENMLLTGLCEDEWCDPVEAVQLMGRYEKVPQEDIQLVLDVFDQYKFYFRDDETRMRVLEVEQLDQVLMGGKYQLTGRRDLTYMDPTDRIWVMDHKTTGRITKTHSQFYAVSGQLLGYAYMARARFGEQFAGLMINLIQLDPSGKIKFERIEMPRSPNLEAKFERTVMDIEESIEKMEQSGRTYDDWPKAINEMTCYGRYGACNHINQCRYGAGGAAGGRWEWLGV